MNTSGRQPRMNKWEGQAAGLEPGDWLVDQRAESRFGLWWARTGVRGKNALWKNTNIRNRGVTAQAICGWRIGEAGAAITGEFEVVCRTAKTDE